MEDYQQEHNVGLIIKQNHLDAAILYQGPPQQPTSWIHLLTTLAKLAHHPVINQPTLLTPEQNHPINLPKPATIAKTHPLLQTLQNPPHPEQTPEYLITLHPPTEWNQQQTTITTAAALIPGAPNLNLPHRYILTNYTAEGTPTNITIIDLTDTATDEHSAALLTLLPQT